MEAESKIYFNPPFETLDVAVSCVFPVPRTPFSNFNPLFETLVFAAAKVRIFFGTSVYTSTDFCNLTLFSHIIYETPDLSRYFLMNASASNEMIDIIMRRTRVGSAPDGWFAVTS